MTKNQKTAIVTGGTSGIGKEISRQFLERGDRVVAIYVNDDQRAKETSAEFLKLFGKGANFTAVKLDVTDEGAVKKFFATLDACDYLVNNAGITIDAVFESQPMSDVKKVIDVNLYGKMNCAKYALPLLKKSTEPRIINIASRFGTRPIMEGVMGYATSEAAIIMMTKVLALEWARFGIRTNTISPSLTPTPLTERVCTAEEFTSAATKNPCGRLGKTADIANMVMYLCSPKSDYINGENININGGALL